MPQRKKSKPKLKIIFDTNVLYTKIAHELLTEDVKSFIIDNSTHSDLSIQWYLSNIVIGERRYQMQSKAHEFLPRINKLEQLLGHKLNITEENLSERVNITIDTQMSSLGISELNLDTDSIDWEPLINRALYRLPPFETGDTEKGFRDSLIAESFFQLVDQSPSTPSICRLIFVTDDKKLTEFLKEYARNKKNVDILKDLNELESLVNTLGSKVGEEFIAEIKDRIIKFFFDPKNRTGLYYEKNISKTILEMHDENLKTVPSDELYRVNGQWYVGAPVFVKKDSQRIYWLTSIRVEANLFKYVAGPPPLDYLDQFMIKQKSEVYLQKERYLSGISKFLAGDQEKVVFGHGYTSFYISWSVRITPQKKLFKDSIIESIDFVSTEWDE